MVLKELPSIADAVAHAQGQLDLKLGYTQMLHAKNLFGKPNDIIFNKDVVENRKLNDRRDNSCEN